MSKFIDISTPKYKNTLITIDDLDYDRLSDYSVKMYNFGDIYIYKNKNKTLTANGEIFKKSLPSFIIGAEKTIYIDGNCLNNKRSNIKECNTQQSLWNSNISRSNQIGYKGVNVYNNYCKARITKDGKTYHLGMFNTPKEAAIAYNNKAIELFGEYAKLNKIRT